MSNDRELSAMMDDVGGKWSDGFLSLTVHLSPEQLLYVLPKGCCECVSSQRRCDVNAACTSNIITSCLGKSQLSSNSSTLILCMLSGCSSYHCGCGGLTHNYSVMSNQSCNHAVVIAAAITAYTTKQHSSQHIDCIYAGWS